MGEGLTPADFMVGVRCDRVRASIVKSGPRYSEFCRTCKRIFKRKSQPCPIGLAAPSRDRADGEARR